MCNFEGCLIYMELGGKFSTSCFTLKCVFMNLLMLFNQADFQSVNCSLLTERETFETQKGKIN